MPYAYEVIAVVTGSSRGIGREVARQLVERKYDVVVTARKAADAARAAKEIGARYSHALDTSQRRFQFLRLSGHRLLATIDGASPLGFRHFESAFALS